MLPEGGSRVGASCPYAAGHIIVHGARCKNYMTVVCITMIIQPTQSVGGHVYMSIPEEATTN